LAVVLLANASPASATDFFGYFRDSIGGNSKGGAQACFKTPGMDYKLRLGNECDNYGEWGLQQSIWKSKDGVEFTVGFMLDYDMDASSAPGTSTAFGVQQNYVKMKVPDWKGAQFWGGKQYYRRENIDMIDFFYLNTSEPGGGVEDVDLGFGKLAASLLQTKGKQGDFTTAFWRPDVRVYGIPTNPNGSLEVAANLILYSKNTGVPAGVNDAKGSFWFTVEHTQEKLLGGSNKLAVQWANGAAAQMGPGAPSFGADPLNKNNQQLRVVEQLLLQPTEQFQALVGAVLQWKTAYATLGGPTEKATQIGIFGRPVYYLSEYFKLQGDLGFTQNKPKGGKAMNLVKATFAPTLTPSVGEAGGFFVRPELRAFVTYGNWNDAAAAAGAAAPGGGLFGTDKSGTSYGLSVETWF
jgi:maltoporin